MWRFWRNTLKSPLKKSDERLFPRKFGAILFYAVAACAITCGPAESAVGQDAAATDDDVRLFEREPFDQIQLSTGEPSVIKVEPIAFPNRQLPAQAARRGKLRVRLLDAPEQEYELDWSQVAEIKLFEQLILDAASALVAAGRLDEAYDYYRYLDANQPKLPGLTEAIDHYMMEDARQSQRRQRYDMALAVLNELHGRNPQFAGLENALGVATSKLVLERLKEENYAAVRSLAAALKEKLPQHAAVERIETELSDMSASAMARARAHVDSGRMSDAYGEAVNALAVLPDLAEARQLLKEIHERHPLVIVGVTLPAGAAADPSAPDWASVRAGRLVHRQLVEFEGYGPDGGQYSSPIAQIAVDNAGQTVVVELERGLTWSDGLGEITGYDVAGRLLELSDSAHPASRPAWMRLLAGVNVKHVYQVEIELARRHVRPSALLDFTLAPRLRVGPVDGTSPTYGPYLAGPVDERERHFVLNPNYRSPAPGQPREIVERVFADSAAALTSLKQGRTSVMDRLSPWAVDELSTDEQIVVGQYAVPTVHCLVPNLNRAFTANRSFRRALVYGIDRQRILHRELLRGNDARGSRVISGPFPAGTELDDPLGYAYNDRVETRPYEPRLAITLAGVALHEIQAAAEKRGEEIAGIPELVLAHAPHDIARAACQAIQRNLKLIGIPVMLEELDPRAPRDVFDDYDLVYAEWIVREPIVDAVRLFQEAGGIGLSSPHLGLAVRQLLVADDWASTRDRLEEVHRLAHDDVAVIPLWQLSEHFAYHRSLEGVGERPTGLYQQVEQWRPQLRLPTDGP